MGVNLTIRKGKLKSTFLLDINSEGKRTRIALKDVFIYNKPADSEEKRHNAEAKALAESKRSEMELSIMYKATGQKEPLKLNTSVLEYFNAYADAYINEDKQKVTAMIGHLQSVHGMYSTFEQVNENYVARVKNYLEKNLSGATAKAYFIKFRQVLRAAYIDKKSAYDTKTFEDTRFKIDDSILSKETLEPEEIQALAKTACSNQTFKMAGLLACFTGFDFADVYELKWKHIQKAAIKKPREKTANKRLLPMHLNVSQILSLMDRETEFVFQDLPGRGPDKKHRKECHRLCSIILKEWVKAAGIEKHITFHCARHTFGTLAEGDDRVIATLLGHKGTRQVSVYRRTKDAKLKASVNSLKPVTLI